MTTIKKMMSITSVEPLANRFPTVEPIDRGWFLELLFLVDSSAKLLNRSPPSLLPSSKYEEALGFLIRNLTLPIIIFLLFWIPLVNIPAIDRNMLHQNGIIRLFTINQANDVGD